MTHHIVKDWRGSGKASAIASFLLSLFISLSIPQLAFAANGDDGNGRTDYDLDDDGLIEINDLADLDEIRNNLDGTTFYAASTGCPAEGCNGFELTVDLDFDTNQDGLMDENDDYWNANGEGWAPIGEPSNTFAAIFEGNGHVISNLYINRPSTDYVGLFGGINNAQIRQLGLGGSLMSVTGDDYVGALVGRVGDNNIINATYNTGSVTGSDDNVGGLAGSVSTSSQITASYNTGSVTGLGRYVGGLAGSVYSNNQITASYSSGYVSGASSTFTGGLIGYSPYSNTTITNSYWAIDSSGQTTSYDSSEDSGYVGLTLVTLQCATDASNSSCVSADGSNEGLNEALILYKDWDGSGYWDFGNNQQLPGLILNEIEHRDSDGDGSLDENDIWPNDRAVSLDQDGDGYPDSWTLGCDDACIASYGLMLDQVPTSAAAWQDSDLDGLVDAWAADCDSTCQSDSGLTLDAYLNDTDNDGTANDNDIDDNNDGITNIDLDRNGLIDISTLAQLNSVRFQLDGTGYRATSDAELDQSGCPVILYQGSYQQRCSGYELSNDLDFDTNQNGVMDENDDYWNANGEGIGEGWSPIGSSSTPFTGIFEGNGHVISNLYINRPSTDDVGLFGYINHAQIRQLGLSGSLMSVVGNYYVGGLAGYVHDNNIINATYNTGSVTGSDDYVGGLAGYVTDDNQITASYNTGSVTGLGRYVGGLAGRVDSGNQITASYNTGSVAGSGNSVGGLAGYVNSNNQITASYNTGSVTGLGRYVGGLAGSVSSSNQITASYSSGYVSGLSSTYTSGLIGYSSSNNTITNSYWAIDSSGQTTSYGSSEDSGYVGLTLATLQCATNLSISGCVSSDGSDEGLDEALALYEDWDSSGYWGFGTSLQLPGIILNGVVHRDSDGDGSLDGDDAFPSERAASLDQDNDGYPDSWAWWCDDACIASSGLMLDQVPTSAAAWQDSDLDGLVDAWAADCDSACQSDSGLILDAFFNDTDNDGTANENDNDDNGDGITDADADSNGLIDISTLAQLNAVRYQLDGSGFRAASDAGLDQSGCPFIVYEGIEQSRCSGYELSNDLDFDTNQDGVMDVNDDYWNANSEGVGEGWVPIGDLSTPFMGMFEGNGHVISNLYINRPSTGYVGLFSCINNAQIRQLGLSGSLMSVMGDDNVGALVGYVNDNNIINATYNTGSVTGSGNYVGGLAGYVDEGNQISVIYNTGSVTGRIQVGGLLGSVNDSNQISTSYNTGSVSGSSVVGGLAGHIYANNQITASYSSGYVSGASYTGGLIGYSQQSNNTITNSYWAIDSSGQTTSYYSSEGTGYVGLTLATLQCATDASNSSCVSADGSNEGLNEALILYKDWDSSGYWDFGTSLQLPSLILNGVVHRDSDGDGAFDENDAYPLISTGELTDTDNDGIPDNCDQACIDAGMAADTDIDNDGVLNIDDVFDYDADESADFDSDNIGDNADTDDDNDGVLDADDAELGVDNGAPELIAIADDASLSVTTENGFNALVIIDDIYMQAFVATDEWDDDLRFEATLNGNVLTKDEDDQVLLPSGNLNIIWVAIDDAGNRSNSLTQNVKVYPRVSFTLVESIIGEASDALIEIELSGESPVYPVTIELEIDVLSEVDQNDLSDSFDISAKHLVVIERGDDESEPNTQVIFVIPVIDDAVSENDELLVVNLNRVIVAEDEENFYEVDETLNQHTLTVTYQNLAPVVQLQLKQGGVEVDNVKQDGGDVTVTAIVTDGNGNDTHTLAWDLNSLGLNVPLGNVLTFSPANLAVGEYSLSVEATDNGINPLSGFGQLSLNVTAPRVTEPDDDAASGGSSGGGGTMWWMLFVLVGVSLQTKRRGFVG